MRFKRSPRHAFTDTVRKRAALARNQFREQDRLPLLSELIAESQPTANQIMAERQRLWEEQEIRDRRRRADQWLHARARLRQLTRREARLLRAAWNRAPYPADPVYLHDFLTRYERGQFTLDALPFD